MHDPLWMRVFLGVHITAGSGAFVLAPLALVTAKGGKAHRQWGKIYFWCMAVVASTALIMSIYRPILFLALVAIFSFYSAFVAYRVLGQKAAWKGESVVKGSGLGCRRLLLRRQRSPGSVSLPPTLVSHLASRRLSLAPSACAFPAEPCGASPIRQRKRCFGGTPTCRA